MDTAVTFVQVMDAGNLTVRTRKVEQGRWLERSIQNILPIRGSGISTYRLFFFRGEEGFLSAESQKSELREVYLRACGCRLQVNSESPPT